jgi:hypothetical protein
VDLGLCYPVRWNKSCTRTPSLYCRTKPQ